MRKLNIAIFGANPYNGNRGIGALAYSILALLEKIRKNNNIEFNYFILNSEFGNKKKDKMIINSDIIPFTNVIPVNISRFRSLCRFIITPEQWMSCIQYLKFDYVLNIGGGDSFSDIYGVTRFNTINGQNLQSWLLRKKYVLLPQTIGPFKSQKIRRKAKFSIEKAGLVFARDEKSLAFVKNNTKRDVVYEGVDLAFFMPYEKQRFSDDNIHVGLNISSLLWHGGYTKDNQFALKLDYQKLVKSIISYFLSFPKVKLHLIPHVVHEKKHIENDYEVSYDILKEYNSDRIVLSPFFLSPICAKSYISGLDFFLGARMHSTIAAFSSGVPVFPMAYSRKFNGLFENTLDYKYFGDMVNQSSDDILENIKIVFRGREQVKDNIADIMKTLVHDKGVLMEECLTKFFVNEEI